MDTRARDRISDGWRLLVAGDVTGSRAAVDDTVDEPAADLLTLQAALVADDVQTAIDGLTRLVEDTPRYASAWATLSAAAERAGREAVALQAAEATAGLWSRGTWRERADDLYARWVDDRLIDAGDRLAGGSFEGALELTRRARELDPDRQDARLLEARALLALDRTDEAEPILTGMTDEPEALQLAAGIAEQRGDLLLALDRYTALPDDWRGRDQSIQRVKRRWRRTVLPPYVQQALASDELSRGQLAAALVALVPQLTPLEGGSVPLLTDIVDEPMQRDIITVVRLGLLDPDPLEPRFHPERTASVDEIRDAITGAAHLLGWEEPVWCESGVVASGCIELSSPVGGDAIEAAVERLAGGEGDE
jgi:hypothetical protein